MTLRHLLEVALESHTTIEGNEGNRSSAFGIVEENIPHATIPLEGDRLRRARYPLNGGGVS